MTAINLLVESEASFFDKIDPTDRRGLKNQLSKNRIQVLVPILKRTKKICLVTHFLVREKRKEKTKLNCFAHKRSLNIIH